MKKFIVHAFVGVALAAPAIAFAASADHNGHTGHYEWRSVPQFSPRASTSTLRHVWVPDAAQITGCNCDMMQMVSDRAADCMAYKQAIASPSPSHHAA